MHFVPGLPHPPHGLFAHYLPPLAEGIAADYAARYSQPGDLVIDPFGQSAQLVIEAALLGRRVVVANFNPVLRFALRLAFDPLSESPLRAALTKLGDTRKDGERLEIHLQNFYRTTCPDCGTAIVADYFEWDKEKDEPVAKAYFCPTDAAALVRPADAADVEAAKKFPAKSLSYHWALDRAAPLGDPDREHAAEALAAYTPRALQALVLLINKLESLSLTPGERRALEAILLAAFDEAASVWPPTADRRARPKTIHPLTRYREFNPWRAMENAVGYLAGLGGGVTLRALDELLQESRPPGAPTPFTTVICLFDGPARELAKVLPPGGAALILSALPRPNPALWGLSALWAAWLWGAETAAPIKAIIHHKRSDFDWHEQSLRRSFQAIRPVLAAGAKMIGLLPEVETGFVEAALTAADGADFSLVDPACRSDPAELQCVWEAASSETHLEKDGIANVIRETALATSRAILLKRGEPARWAAIHAAIWTTLAERRLLKAAVTHSPDHPIALAAGAVAEGHLSVPGYVRFGTKREADLDEGLWWLRESAGAEEALADRVERAVAQLLAAREALDEADVEAGACRAFPGLLAPGRRLVRACLHSYGEVSEAGTWRLRAEDAPATRSADREEISALLSGLGSRLGYTVKNESGALEWREAGHLRYAFFVTATAAIGAYLLGPAPRAELPFVVLAGGRAGLVAYKLQRDPRLKQAADKHSWGFLKYRLVRRVAADAGIDRAAFSAMLDLDPIVEKAAAQMPLL